MDTLAHGLWGGAAFGQKEKNHWKWAFWLGMAPDIFSFGPFFLGRIGDVGERLIRRSGPPDPSTIPAYVYHAYNVTHSLIIGSLLFVVVWRWRKKVFWPLAAWMLHILCDIPTHSTQFFPTPYIWPLPTPFYNGTSWGNQTFMIWNYALIFTAYLGIFFYKKRKP